MKVIRNYVSSCGLKRPNGDAAQTGDTVRLYLDIVANPTFPDTIQAKIVYNITKTKCCGYSYSFEYDAEEIIRVCDILDVEVLDCCTLLDGRVSLLETVASQVFTPEQFNEDAGSGSDDTEAIQKAIDACTEAGGGYVQFEAKEYIYSQLIVNGHAVKLRGAGNHSTFLRCNSESGNGIIFGQTDPAPLPGNPWPPIQIGAGISDVSFWPLVTREADTWEIDVYHSAHFLAENLGFGGEAAVWGCIRGGSATSLNDRRNVGNVYRNILARRFQKFMFLSGTVDNYFFQILTDAITQNATTWHLDGGNEAGTFICCDSINSYGTDFPAPPSTSGACLLIEQNIYAGTPSRFNVWNACYFDTHFVSVRISRGEDNRFIGTYHTNTGPRGIYLSGDVQRTTFSAIHSQGCGILFDTGVTDTVIDSSDCKGNTGIHTIETGANVSGLTVSNSRIRDSGLYTGIQLGANNSNIQVVGNRFSNNGNNLIGAPSLAVVKNNLGLQDRPIPIYSGNLAPSDVVVMDTNPPSGGGLYLVTFDNNGGFGGSSLWMITRAGPNVILNVISEKMTSGSEIVTGHLSLAYVGGNVQLTATSQGAAIYNAYKL